MKKYPHQIGVGGLVLTDYEKQLVNQVLDSNRLTYGPMSEKLEADFANSHGTSHGLFMNSGTSALHVALAALKNHHGWHDGDEVIVPAVTFPATANVVLHNRMTPIFVDVEPDTYNIDPTQIEAVLTSKTRAIIPVHLLGLPASMGPIRAIAETFHLAIIEDSCETMFATYKGQPVGSMGDIGCFSTYVAHFLVTGVGGFAITNNSELAVDMRSLINHGRDGIYFNASDDANAEGELLSEIVSKRFRFIHVGHSFRCTEMEAAIGLGQLVRKDEILTRRKEIAQTFTKELAHLQDVLQLPTCPEDRTHSWMLYGVVLRNENKRELVNYLEQLNIETRDLLPIINQPIYKRLYGDLESKSPVAKHINDSGFYFGCHSYMSDEEGGYIIEAINNYFQK